MLALRHAAMAALLSLVPTTLLAQPAAAPAAAETTGSDVKTVAVVALAGYDRLLEDIDFLGELGGRPASADMVEGMLAFFTGGRGLEGLDKSRPIGVVLRTDGMEFLPLVCLPIADLDPFLELAEQFGLEPVDAGDGVYEIETPDQQQVFIKRRGEWTYAAQTAEALAKVPADPSGPLKKIVGEYDLGVMALVQNVPELYRTLALEGLAQGMEEGLRQGDDESDENFAQRRRLAETQIDQLRDAIEGLDRLTVGLNIDSEGRTTFLDMQMTAVPGSDMALAMGVYDDTTTGVSGFHRPESATLSVLMSGVTPPELLEKQREQIESAITMLRTQAKQAIADIDPREIDSEADTQQRAKLFEEAVNGFIDVYADMAREGKIEIGASLDLEGEGYDLVAGAYAADPSKVESAFKKLAEASAINNDKFPGVEWGYATHAGVTMHRMVISVAENFKDLDEDGLIQSIYGDEVTCVMGTGEKYVYFGLGPRCEAALKRAIDDSASMTGKQVKPLEMIFAMGQFFAAAEPLADAEAKPMLGLLLDAFEKAPAGKDRLSVTMEGVENGARFRLLIEEGVLQAFGQSAAAAAAMQQQGGF